MSRARKDSAQILEVFAWLFSAAWIGKWTRHWERSHPKAPRWRERCFSLRVTLWCLIWQRLCGGATLQEVVTHVLGGHVDRLHGGRGGRLCRRLRSLQTSAYHQARQRLPLELILDAWRASCARLIAWVLPGPSSPPEASPQSRSRVWIDGSTLRVKAHPQISKRFAAARTRNGDSDWSLIRICAAFCSRCGAVLYAALSGHYVSEQTLAWELMLQAQAGTIWIGDRNFGVWSVAAQAVRCRQDVVVRLSRDRAKALAKSAHRAEGGELLVSWRPKRRARIPPGCENIEVTGRLIQVCVRRGSSTVRLWLFTTLMDRTLYPVDLLVRWYGERWGAELNFRSLKTELGLSTLWGVSADMVEKEFYVGILAYNLVRVLMWRRGEADSPTPEPPLSFNLCRLEILEWMEEWSRWPTRRGLSLPKALEQLRRELARCLLPRRRGPRRSYGRIVRNRPPSKFPGFSGSREVAEQRHARLAEQKHPGIDCPIFQDA